MGRLPFVSLSILLVSCFRSSPLILFSCAQAAIINQTIDDSLGDLVTGAQVQYHPLSQPTNISDIFWKNEDECRSCSIVPDRTLAFNGTWTGATYFATLGQMSATMSIEGTAIYVYLIISNAPVSTGLVSTAICDFVLDGNIAGNFQHDTDGSNVFQYNVMAFSQDGLSSGSHTLSIQTTGTESSYIIFDRAVYTTEVNDAPSSSPFSPSPPSSSPSPISVASSSAPESSSQIAVGAATPNQRSTPVGAIAGGVVGGVAALALLMMLSFYLRRRRARINSMTPTSEIGGDSNLALMAESLASSSYSGANQDLERQIAERNQEIHSLARSSTGLPSSSSSFGNLGSIQGPGGSSIQQQMEEIRFHIQRLQSEQRSSGYSSSAPVSDPASNTSTAGRSGRVKKPQMAVQNLPSPIARDSAVVIHSDSGLRMARGVTLDQYGDEKTPREIVELPPTYAPD